MWSAPLRRYVLTDGSRDRIRPGSSFKGRLSGFRQKIRTSRSRQLEAHSEVMDIDFDDRTGLLWVSSRFLVSTRTGRMG